MLHDAMIPLRAIADSIAARGIRHITGRVVAVRRRVSRRRASATAGRYDDFEDSYSAPIDELLFNEGFSELHVRGGDAPGDPVRVDGQARRGRFRACAHGRRPSRRRPDTTRARRADTLRARKDSTTWDVILEGQIGVARHDDDRSHAPRSRRGVRRGGARGAARQAGSRSIERLGGHDGARRHARDAVVAAAQRDPQGAA